MSKLGDLKIELVGLRNTKGNIVLALFSDSQGYPDKPEAAVRSEVFTVTDVSMTITISDIPYGNYAVTIFHDENADSELNTNLLGIPQEGIGFSGNPKIWKGVPKYEKSQFNFSPDQEKITIKVKYLL